LNGVEKAGFFDSEASDSVLFQIGPLGRRKHPEAKLQAHFQQVTSNWPQSLDSSLPHNWSTRCFPLLLASLAVDAGNAPDRGCAIGELYLLNPPAIGVIYSKVVCHRHLIGRARNLLDQVVAASANLSSV